MPSAFFHGIFPWNDWNRSFGHLVVKQNKIAELKLSYRVVEQEEIFEDRYKQWSGTIYSNMDK